MARVVKRDKSWQIDYFDPNGKRIRKSFKKKKEATDELAKRVSLIAEGRYLDVKLECKTRFGELLNKYEENYKKQSWYKTGKQYAIKNLKEYFGTIKCPLCGYNKDFRGIVFHHKKDKTYNISSLIRIKPTPERIEELAKCEVLCANCHNEGTFESYEEFQQLLQEDV